MNIKKIIITIAIVIGIANANEADLLYKNYMEAGGKVNQELQELLKKDTYYQKAIAETEKPSEIFNAKDPEALKMIPYEIKKINWNTVYENLVMSNKEYKNPISSYYGVYIIDKFIGRENKLDDFKKFSETLYEKEKNMCESYLNYGAVFEKGLGVPVDYKMAKDVYEKGLKEACKTGWKKQVVESKISFLKRKI